MVALCLHDSPLHFAQADQSSRGNSGNPVDQIVFDVIIAEVMKAGHFVALFGSARSKLYVLPFAMKQGAPIFRCVLPACGPPTDDQPVE